MRRFFKLISVPMLALVTAAVIGCGGGSSNNQGVSFTLLGFFESGEDDAAGQVGSILPLSSQFETSEAISGSVFVWAGAMNNLSQQFIRTDGMFLSYFIPGATSNPPRTATSFGMILGPAVGDSTEGQPPFDSSLPPSFADEENAPSNVAKIEVNLLPPDIRTWINLNRTSLPEPPFDMIITAYATGLTSAGDRIDSNKAQYLVQFTPDNIIPPAQGDTGAIEEAPAEGE